MASPTLPALALIGQCINPTGRPELARAIAAGDFAPIAALARAQFDAGATYIDINVAVPGIDEGAALKCALHAVTFACPAAVPVADSADPDALARALDGYAGPVVLNSATAAPGSMRAVLKIAKGRDADVIALAMERRPPLTVAGRLAALERILDCADAVGVGRGRVIADCLVTMCAIAPEQIAVTLDALAAVKAQLGLRTVLGISNASGGLPARPALDCALLGLAVSRGLDMAIVNPLDARMMDAVAALRLLTGHDADAAGYISRMRGR